MTSEPNLSSFIDEPAAVGNLARATRRVVKIIAVLLPALIAGLSLRDLTLESVVSVLSKSSDMIWKASVLLYFCSLIFGAYSDIDDQARVYRAAPDRGRLPFTAVAIISLLAVTGGALAYSPSFGFFAGALAVFWAIFAIGWKYMVAVISRPIIKSSRDGYLADRNHAGVERTAVIEDFVTGHWQVWRFAAGGVLALAILGLAVAEAMGVDALPTLGAINWDLVKALAMLVVVVAVETWIWAKRIKMKALLMGLDRLSERYHFAPIETARDA